MDGYNFYVVQDYHKLVSMHIAQTPVEAKVAHIRHWYEQDVTLDGRHKLETDPQAMHRYTILQESVINDANLEGVCRDKKCYQSTDMTRDAMIALNIK